LNKPPDWILLKAMPFLILKVGYRVKCLLEMVIVTIQMPGIGVNNVTPDNIHQ